MTGLTLFIDRPGSHLDTGGADTLTVEAPGQRSLRVGARAIDNVVLAAETTIAAAALTALVRNGISLSVMPLARAPGICWAQPGSRGARLRHAQHLARANPSQHLELAKWFVRAKIERHADHLQNRWPEAAQALRRALAAVDAAGTVDAARSAEARAARLQWGVWMREWAPDWGFRERARRPSPDPINALLSLGSSLATAEAARAAAMQGFDPWLGYLHVTRPPAPALALDLVEFARARVLGWTEAVIPRLGLRPSDFDREPDGGVTLGAVRRREVFADWFAQAAPPVRHDVQEALKGLADRLTQLGAVADDR